MKPTRIKNWAEEDRPREKMLQKGVASLSDSELLAILLASGNKDETAVDLARRILKDAGDSLQELSKHTVKSLSKYKGVGLAKAVTVMAALELGKRRVSSDVSKKQKVECSKDIYDLICVDLLDKQYECVWAIFLDPKNKILHKELIGTGGITASALDPNRLLRTAIEVYAMGIIICHNHPSGSITPSKEDIQLTKTIKEAAKLLNIKVLDHIIVGENRYYSFADEGLILHST
ncbi:MAG: DNA repair protein RadC [Bacteroidales bacterium]|nr:DNA repair protein RadC [Bacteroidales bacterium]